MGDEPETKSPPTVGEILDGLRSGQLQELQARMPELSQSVRATGKKATITIKLSMSPSKTDDYAVELAEQIKVAEPQPSPTPTLMFVDDDGRLSKTDPRARQLPGMEVDK